MQYITVNIIGWMATLAGGGLFDGYNIRKSASTYLQELGMGRMALMKPRPFIPTSSSGLTFNPSTRPPISCPTLGWMASVLQISKTACMVAK